MEQSFEIDFSQCPANIAILEQTVLARNSGQHPDEITLLDVRHTEKTLEKYPLPFFANEIELKITSDNEGNFASLFPPRIEIDRYKLFEAIAQAEHLTTWLESQLIKIRWPQS